MPNFVLEITVGKEEGFDLGVGLIELVVRFLDGLLMRDEYLAPVFEGGVLKLELLSESEDDLFQVKIAPFPILSIEIEFIYEAGESVGQFDVEAGEETLDLTED